MKDKLIHDIELKLAISCPGMDRERILQCVISCLNDYDVTARETGITVRYEDTNERILPRNRPRVNLSRIRPRNLWKREREVVMTCSPKRF